MNVKLGDLVNGENALAEMAQNDVSARLSFTLSLVLKEVGKHLEAKRAAHQKLLEKYGTPREDRPGFYDITPEHRAKFEKEFKELLDTEVTLSGIGKIPVSALEAEGLKFTAHELLTLAWLLKEDVQPIFEEES
jgi:hypothetical protein